MATRLRSDAFTKLGLDRFTVSRELGFPFFQDFQVSNMHAVHQEQSGLVWFKYRGGSGVPGYLVLHSIELREGDDVQEVCNTFLKPLVGRHAATSTAMRRNREREMAQLLLNEIAQLSEGEIVCGYPPSSLFFQRHAEIAKDDVQNLRRDCIVTLRVHACEERVLAMGLCCDLSHTNFEKQDQPVGSSRFNAGYGVSKCSDASNSNKRSRLGQVNS